MFRRCNMIQLVFEQALGPEFSEDFDLVVALTDAQKAQIYDLRCRSAYSDSPNRGIDPFDSLAHHLYLSHRKTGRAIAATRLIPKASLSGKGTCLPIEQRLQPEVRRTGLYLPAHVHQALAGEVQVSELSEVHLLPEKERESLFQLEEDVLIQAMTLSAYALARLLFHDVLLCELNLERFKLFRARGLQFEYASALAEDDAQKAVFYLESHQEIRASSPYYNFYQSMSDQIAPQLNMPDFSDLAADS